MMMAFDSNPSPRLDEGTLSAVRAALVRYLRDGVQTRELHDTLTAMAREARDRHVPAEQMLIAMKTLWSELPEVRTAEKNRDTNRDRLLDRIVTICIQQYYLLT